MIILNKFLGKKKYGGFFLLLLFLRRNIRVVCILKFKLLIKNEIKEKDNVILFFLEGYLNGY